MNVERTKWPLGLATEVAKGIMAELMKGCRPGYCVMAGSARRGKAEVGDVEILYVPGRGLGQRLGEMFESEVDTAAEIIEGLLAGGVMERRLNSEGRETWGPQIKLARHVGTGVPVDLFSTSEGSWWNYLVCRTGPAESNTAIASAARKRGWKWEPYSSGFVRLGVEAPFTLKEENRYVVRSEREVFEFVGLNYLEPGQR